MSQDLFRRNRPFFVRMRDEAYKQAYARFQEMAATLRPSDLPEKETREKEALRALEAFIAALKTAFDHASDAIRGLKRRHLRMYREDQAFGVLEEEVVLCHFLEEMLSSSHFLHARINTDLKMRLYRQRLKRIQTQAPGGDGFIATILESVGRFQDTEVLAIGKVLDLMEQRWQVGHRLNEITRQKLAGWLAGGAGPC